ncbi:hypothetical protein [Cellulomonas wangsupingiae]|uniref:Uncharacterized protein n=1 Tax=Cellulomonas wangsupingiae TaxID=2968085 RepID=A0ABY5K4I6_9CELL|nr:hypothetical protein [Cellulomonas wangsupingiae]MCC2333622.1 hypothetical protein [Cellulomonas wangsupingiae]UUI64890.1 hypothetical protein NP075_17535 [Cellulomonas wangsupingiae]
MTVPDDTTTPTPDEVPDPVTATAPRVDPASGGDDGGLPPIEETVLPKDSSRTPGLPGYA